MARMLVGHKYTQQRVLEAALTSLFTHYPPHNQLNHNKNNKDKDNKDEDKLIIHNNARARARLMNPATGYPLEIDVYIPLLKLGFEYQDIHHYTSKWYANDTLKNYRFRDGKGYSLITIPYWWDQTLDSLVATIRLVRPDVLSNYQFTSHALPISSSPPHSPVDECIYELMVPMFASSAQKLTSWWMSEKYDGVRAIWNPVSKKIISRQGREMEVIYQVRKQFANLIYDGEVWFGRGDYNMSSQLLYKNFSAKASWEAFRYIVFDQLSHKEKSYEDRVRALLFSLADPAVYLDITYIFASQIQSKGEHHIQLYTTQILESDGEGTIVRKPHSLYISGKTDSLLKIKRFKDAEALIIATETVNDTQIYTCKMANGVVFEAGVQSSNLLPRVGDIVSFTFTLQVSPHTAPKQPVIYRIRNDVVWPLDSTPDPGSLLSSLNVASKALINRDPSPVHTTLSYQENQDQNEEPRVRGHWTVNESENVRKFFDKLAQKRKMDPLKASSWYPLPRRLLPPSMPSHYSSAYHALFEAYPSLSQMAEQLVSRDNIKTTSLKYLLYLCVQNENQNKNCRS